MWRAVEAFNHHDPDAFAELCAPEVEIVPLRAAMEGTVYRGPDAVARFFAEADETWEDLRLEEGEVRDVGERALAFATLHGRGRASGAVVEMKDIGWVFEFRDGLIAAVRTYFSREAALEAAQRSE